MTTKMTKELEVTIKVPHAIHKFIVGKKGHNVNRLRTKHWVSITLPHPLDEDNDDIAIKGPPKNVLDAALEIKNQAAKHITKKEKTPRGHKLFKLLQELSEQGLCK